MAEIRLNKDEMVRLQQERIPEIKAELLDTWRDQLNPSTTEIRKWVEVDDGNFFEIYDKLYSNFYTTIVNMDGVLKLLSDYLSVKILAYSITSEKAKAALEELNKSLEGLIDSFTFGGND